MRRFSYDVSSGFEQSAGDPAAQSYGVHQLIRRQPAQQGQIRAQGIHF
jgi:hypothetical protein